MACKKHGYTNNVFCPACDLEEIEEHKLRKTVETSQMFLSRAAMDALTRAAQTIGGLDGVAIIDILDRCAVVEPPAASAEAQDVDELVRLADIAFDGYNSSLVPSARLDSTATTRLAMANAVEAVLSALTKQPASTPALREVTTEDAREASNARRAVIYSLPCIEGGYKDHDELELAAMIVALESFRASLSTKQE